MLDKIDPLPPASGLILDYSNIESSLGIIHIDIGLRQRRRRKIIQIEKITVQTFEK
jgi:hypothetical protein